MFLIPIVKMCECVLYILYDASQPQQMCHQEYLAVIFWSNFI